MDTKLTDFTIVELTTLLTCVLLSEINIKARILEREHIFEKAGAEYPMDVPEVKLEHDELERLQLWHTQILTAVGKVGVRDEINSN